MSRLQIYVHTPTCTICIITKFNINFQGMDSGPRSAQPGSLPVGGSQSEGERRKEAPSRQQPPSKGRPWDQSSRIVNCLRDNRLEVTKEGRRKRNPGQFNKVGVTGVLRESSGPREQSHFIFNLHTVKIDFLRLIQIYDTSGDI